MGKILKAAAITGAALGAAYVAVGNLFYELALTKEGVAFSNKYMPAIDEETFEFFRTNELVKAGNEWFASTPMKKLVAYNESGERCHALLAEASEPSNVYVICCHGYGSRPADMGIYGLNFKRMGFNTVFPSLNGHYNSENRGISMGWLDRLLITAWVKYIVENNPDAQIILHGVSMGSAAVMMATGERMPENVKCCVADCGYTSVWDEFSVKIREYLHLPIFPFLYCARDAARIRGKFDFKKASALEQVQKSVTPTLFIHGDKDVFVPFWMQHPLYSKAVCEKEKLVVPGAAHAISAYVNPELYWGTVERFTAKYINQNT